MTGRSGLHGRLDDGSPLARGARLGLLVSARRVAVLLLVVGLLSAAVLAVAGEISRRPDTPTAAPETPSITGRYLAGARGPTCLRLIFGVDDSGSMRDFASARDQAFDQIFQFAKANLRPDDEIQIVDFAMVAADRLPVARVDRLAASVAAPVAVRDGRDTNLRPVMELIQRTPRSPCERALVLLSDAQLADLPADADTGLTQLRESGVRDVRLLVPGTAVDVWPQWAVAFPFAAEDRFDGRNADQTGIAIGTTIAALTGQTLASH